MRVMAIDYKTARTGVALSDETRTLATPLTVINSRDRDWVLAQLKKLTVEHGVTQLVVGLPLNMDGSEGPAAQLCREVAGILERKTRLPVDLVDERLSTVEAARFTSDRKRLDAVAAAVILQEWLGSRRASS